MPKQERVSMPMASAGIVGFSSDIKISGYEIEPKVVIIFAVIFTLVIKIASIAITV